MEWHYAIAGEQHGPVSREELRQLRESGVISHDSLVWNESLPDWLPLRDCEKLLDTAGTTTSEATGPLAVCAWSGKTMAESQMLQYGDQWVAPECKDLFIQRLREGGVGQDDAALMDADELAPDLSFVSIITQSARIWWGNFASIALIMAIIWTPLNLILEYIAYQQLATEETVSELVQGVRNAIRYDRIAEFWIGVIATGGVIWVANRSWEGRPKATVGQIFGAGFRNWGRMLITRFFFGVLLLLILIPGLLIMTLGEPILTAIGVIYLVFAAGIFYVRHCLAEMAAVCDQDGGTAALEQSRRVTKGRFWMIVGYQIVVFGCLLTLAALVGLTGLIPVFDNFVVSALLSTVVNVIVSFGIVEMLVLYRHLDANAEP